MCARLARQLGGRQRTECDQTRALSTSLCTPIIHVQMREREIYNFYTRRVLKNFGGGVFATSGGARPAEVDALARARLSFTLCAERRRETLEPARGPLPLCAESSRGIPFPLQPFLTLTTLVISRFPH